MEKWMIPVIWEMWGLYKIEAETLEEAKKKSFDLPLPDNGEYIEDSFRIDEDGIPLHNQISLGICPRCKSRNLKYDGRIFEANIISYYFTCQDCEATGHEIYKMEYIKTLLNPAKIEKQKLKK